MEESEESMSQERKGPETVYSCFQISPAPPAFLVMAITTATQVIVTTTKQNQVSTSFLILYSSSVTLLLDGTQKGNGRQQTEFKDEEPLQLVRRGQQDRKLDRPEN